MLNGGASRAYAPPGPTTTECSYRLPLRQCCQKVAPRPPTRSSALGASELSPARKKRRPPLAREGYWRAQGVSTGMWTLRCHHGPDA
jgi:hypothetical protein